MKANWRGMLNQFQVKNTNRAPSQAEFELLEESGPPHQKIFSFQCVFILDGQKFETTGKSSKKKLAKSQAAKEMWEKVNSHVQSGGGGLTKPITSAKPPPASPAGNTSGAAKAGNFVRPSFSNGSSQNKSVPPSPAPTTALTEITATNLGDTNYVGQLHEFCQTHVHLNPGKPEFELAQRNPNDKNFTMTVTITLNGERKSATGTANNKKRAKHVAAALLLRELPVDPNRKKRKKGPMNNSGRNQKRRTSLEPTTLHSDLAQQAEDAYEKYTVGRNFLLLAYVFFDFWFLPLLSSDF